MLRRDRSLRAGRIHPAGAFDANNGYSVGGAIRRALEELALFWFEEPVHNHVRAMGEVARALDITVSAGEADEDAPGVADPIAAGVRMVQPDIVKMGGISGLLQCAALRHAHGVELVPHQTQPTIGHATNMHVMGTAMHLAKSFEVTDNPRRLNALFKNAPEPQIAAFPVSSGPGLGLALDLVKPP